MRTALCAAALLSLSATAEARAAATDPGATAAPAPTALAPQVAPAPRAASDQPPVPLSLRDAIEAALRSDPQVLAALVQADRSQLGVLRSQLDRFSLRVDASLSEQYRAANLGGPAIPDACGALIPVAGGLVAPTQLFTVGGETPSAAACAAAGAAFQMADQVPTSGVGLFNVAASLQVPIFSGFRVTANVERAGRTRDAARAQVKSTARQIALDVLRTYWSIRRVELQYDVAKGALARLDDAAQVVAARVRAGLVPSVEQNRIETRRQRELARLRDLEGQAAEGRAQLAVALGLTSTNLRLSETAEVPQVNPAELGPSAQVSADSVDRLLDEARGARPELVLARRNIDVALQNVRIAKSAYYPQLTGSALLQFGNNPFNPLNQARATSNNNPNPFTNISGSLFLGATLSVNIFDTLNTYTAVRDARYEVARLEQEERRLGRLVEADVRTAQARLQRLYSYREPLLRTRELANDTLGVIERRYRNGDALILDYIDAQVDLLNAEVDLANSAAAIAQAWGELYAATGRAPR